jgi:hypothetical protein
MKLRKKSILKTEPKKTEVKSGQSLKLVTWVMRLSYPIESTQNKITKKNSQSFKIKKLNK